MRKADTATYYFFSKPPGTLIILSHLLSNKIENSWHDPGCSSYSMIIICYSTQTVILITFCALAAQGGKHSPLLSEQPCRAS